MSRIQWLIVTAGLALNSVVRAEDPLAEPVGVEVLARGPVHEAVALPVNSPLAPSPIVAKQPPAPIDELPPDQKPDGDDVQWIPGYWAWDDEQMDFIWISGFWRAPPPGRRWQPGHWQDIDKGWVWVAGFWVVANAVDFQYLPSPPPSVDQGPSVPAPDDNSTYVPGIWVYQQTGFRWRPGFWYGNMLNWIWIPAHYIWTPSGCLYIEGYWDHPLDESGLLFAPVRFGRSWGNQRFTPQYVVNADFMMGALFVGPAARQFYFGDYFEKGYATRGFVAWPDYRIGRTGYDPTFNYYRNQHASQPRWETGLRDLYRARGNGEVARPPQRLNQQVQNLNTIAGNKSGNLPVHKNINLTHIQNVTALTPLKEIHNTNVTHLESLGQTKDNKIPVRTIKVEPVTNDAHVCEVKAAAQIHAAAQQRHDQETKMLHQGGIPVKHTDPPVVVKVQLPKALPPVAPVKPVQLAPAAPALPKHEDKPIPKYEPHQPPGPPPKKK